MGKNKRSVKNNKKPKNSVSNTQKVSSKLKVRIDFVANSNIWLKAVKVKDYTNFLKDEKQFSKYFYKVMNILIPAVQQDWEKMLSDRDAFPHCHDIRRDARKKVNSLLSTMYPNYDESMEVMQLGLNGSPRIIVSIIREDNISVIRPLFIDYHHLIYPDDWYNKEDVDKYTFCPYRSFN